MSIPLPLSLSIPRITYLYLSFFYSSVIHFSLFLYIYLCLSLFFFFFSFFFSVFFSVLSYLLTQGSIEEVHFEITRSDFEQGCSTLFERSLAPVSRLLSDLGETSKIFCGGISRVNERRKSVFSPGGSILINDDATFLIPLFFLSYLQKCRRQT